MVRNLQNRNNVSGNWKNRFQLLRHLQNYVQASQNQKLAARHKLTVTETYRNFVVRGQTQSSLRQSRHHLIDDLAALMRWYLVCQSSLLHLEQDVEHAQSDFICKDSGQVLSSRVREKKTTLRYAIRKYPESTVLHYIQINNLVDHIQQHVISFIPNHMYCDLKSRFCQILKFYLEDYPYLMEQRTWRT